jgi:hypothetical protein
VDHLVAEMPEYCGCCGKFVWPSGDASEDWEVSWGLNSEELSRTLHLRTRCGPLYCRVPSFVSFSLCLNFKHFMIYVL